MPLVFFLLLAVQAFSFSTVVIDPGHGGNDGGAYHKGVKEADLNLKVARKLKKELERKGIKVVMTRYSDQTMSITTRANIANRYPNSILVSIHFNGHRSSQPRGIETFYVSSTGRRIASQIQSRLISALKSKNRGIKYTTGLSLLTKTKAPAVLVECGFLSNSYERNRCNTDWYQTVTARKIAEGIVAYKKSR